MNGKLKGGLMVGGFVLALVVGLLAGYSYLKEQSIPETLGLNSWDFQKTSSDVVGSKTVTTTVYALFGVAIGETNPSATSTYITKIGASDRAVYSLMVGQASTTSHLTFEVEGSFDYYCDTTATSGGNLPLVSEIAWFSAGDHFKDKVHSTVLNTASTTQSIRWGSPMAGSGQQLILENLDYECLRLSVSGTSSTLWSQISTK